MGLFPSMLPHLSFCIHFLWLALPILFPSLFPFTLYIHIFLPPYSLPLCLSSSFFATCQFQACLSLCAFQFFSSLMPFQLLADSLLAFLSLSFFPSSLPRGLKLVSPHLFQGCRCCGFLDICRFVCFYHHTPLLLFSCLSLRFPLSAYASQSIIMSFLCLSPSFPTEAIIINHAGRCMSSGQQGQRGSVSNWWESEMEVAQQARGSAKWKGSNGPSQAGAAEGRAGSRAAGVSGTHTLTAPPSFNVPHGKASCSQRVRRSLGDPGAACCTVDQASFYRNTSLSASWHLQARRKFLSIKELAGGSHPPTAAGTSSAGRRWKSSCQHQAGERRKEAMRILVSDIDMGRKVESQCNVVVGKGGQYLWQRHCGMVGIWPVTTSKIDANVLCLQREEGLALPCFGKWRRAKCRRHSVAGRLSLQAWWASSPTAVLI